MEIKSAMTWNTAFAKSIRWFQQHIPDAMSDHGAVIYAGDQHFRSEHYQALHFSEVDRLFPL